jgi:hypothetical protein
MGHYRFQLFQQSFDLLGRDCPDDVKLDLIVAMNNPVADPDHIPPWNLRVSLPKLDGEARRSLTD